MSHHIARLPRNDTGIPIAMTPWVKRWAARFAGVRIPEGVRVAMGARGPRGPFVANVFTIEAGQVAHVWDALPERALRIALIVAGVARCNVCGEPDDGFHPLHTTTVKTDPEGYVRSIE